MTQAEPAPRKRRPAIAWGAIPVVALAGLLCFDHIPGTDISLTVPYAAEGPGPMFDTLGEVSGEPVVRIDGTDTDETSGALNMTTVSVRTNMTLPQALGRWIATDDTLVPVAQILPPDLTEEEAHDYNQQEFVASEASATVAAMHYLGKPTKVVVHQAVEGSAADGRLDAGDTIRAVDTRDVEKPSDVQDIVRAKHPGDAVDLTVERDGQTRQETITLGENPGDKGVAMLGILMTSEPAGDINVEYNLNDVGGPSAGMIFSLAVIDKLSPGELTGGRNVAGTGTIADDGTVGPIGGITHKLAAAKNAGVELFLAPEDNCGEVEKFKPGSMTVASVSALDDAVAAMDDFAAGRDVTTCSPQ